MFNTSSSNRRKHWWRILPLGPRKLMFLGCLLLVLLLVVLGALISYSYRAAQFDVDSVVSGEPVTAMYDYNNSYIATLPDTRYIAVTWSDLPQNLVNAFVAREDEDFFEHDGIVYSAIVRSILKNLSSMSYEQGASTITMQLTRNVFEMQGKTLDRKILEAFVARRIEERYDKQTILIQYLNRIYFGQNCYGVGAAASHYFGKHVKDLSLAECATLAGLVRGPSIFNPRTDIQSAETVKKETLERMRELQFISDAECQEAIATTIEPVAVVHDAASAQTYLMQWANTELAELTNVIGEHPIGMGIVTTFDLELQQYVEEAAERALVAVENRLAPFPLSWEPLFKTPELLSAEKKYFAKDKLRPAEFKVRGDSNEFTGLLQCCVLVLDGRPNHAGEVLAITSGRGVSDGINRWRQKVCPGRNAAPLLFCSARAQHDFNAYILPNDVLTTGEKTGYNNVASFYRSILPGVSLPPEARAEELYRGHFPVRRDALAKVLFSIQNGGRCYDFYSIKSVWSRARHELYSHVRQMPEEWIHRQSADTVAALSPFVRINEKQLVLSEPLADNGGYWTMVSNARGTTVFVWMGFDQADTPGATSASLLRLIQKASVLLAREIHLEARKRLIERPAGK